jgi:hypothetical protein
VLGIGVRISPPTVVAPTTSDPRSPEMDPAAISTSLAATTAAISASRAALSSAESPPDASTRMAAKFSGLPMT